jgi:hypothetical protein
MRELVLELDTYVIWDIQNATLRNFFLRAAKLFTFEDRIGVLAVVTLKVRACSLVDH